MPSKASVLMIAALYSVACVAADEAPKVQPPPLWSGSFGWLIHDTSIHVYEGTQPIGGVLVEHDMDLKRTGILKQSVRLTDDSGAEMILPEGSKAFAAELALIKDGKEIAGSNTIEWCVVPAKDPGSVPETVCIYWESEQRARYDQYLRHSGLAFTPVTGGRLNMQGALPQIEEGPVDFGLQFKHRHRLVALSEKDVTIETIYSDGTHTSADRRETYGWENSDKFLYKAGGDLIELTRTADGKSVDVRHVTEPMLGVNTKEVTALLELLVGVDGRVKDGRIEKSTGNPEMDAKILAEVKRSWKLTPGTKKGKPVEMWGKFAVTFKLTE